MPLTTTVSMLRKAQEQGFAVGAFNVENMEMAQAIISAAEELRAPVILQTTPSTVRYAGTGMYAAMVAALAQEATVPVAMHLDHGDSFALCAQALRSGYTSVMIDGSKLPLEENIAYVAEVEAETLTLLEEAGVEITDMTDAMYEEFTAAEAPVIEKFTTNDLVRAYYEKALSLQ